MRGRFIVIEGPDGCGKSLHTGLLAERLQQLGHKVLLTEEPTTSEIGKDIRHILSGGRKYHPETIQLLFCADRADHVASVIEPALESGTTVVCSRYTLSTICYGTVKGVDRTWLTRVNDHFLQPDCTIMLLPPIEICMQRLGIRAANDVHENEQMVRATHALYTEFAAALPPDAVVNTAKAVDIASKQIVQAVLTHAFSSIDHASYHPLRA